MASRRQKMTNRWLTYGSIALLNACVAMMFAVILWPRPAMPVLAMESPVPLRHAAAIRAPIKGMPVRIQVPSAGIDTGVQPGNYDQANNTWTINTSSAFYATASVPVNNTNGTTLIYGHAGWGIFENLPRVSEGAQAFVYTNDGNIFMYNFESNRQVNPNDVSFITTAGVPQLVLQTCSGAFDSYRTLVTFKLDGVKRDG